MCSIERKLKVALQLCASNYRFHYNIQKKMKRYSLFLMITGGILSAFCFFMPWIKLVLPSDNGMSIVPKITGIREATSGLNFATLSLIAVLAILGISVYYILNRRMPRKLRTVAQISCIIGVLCILLTLIQFVASYQSYITVAIGTYLARNPQAEFEFDLYKIYRVQLGGYGAVIGFILAYIGACNIPKSDLLAEKSE